MPIATDPKGETKSHPAVIPTNPAKTPFNVKDKEGFQYLNQLVNKANRPPAHAAKFVVKNTCDIAVRFSIPAAAN